MSETPASPGTAGASYYPPPAFSFAVALATAAGQPPSLPDAQFSEVSGIDPQVEVEDLAEGGVNRFVHTLPGQTRHGNLVLKRGIVTRGSALATWAGQVAGSSLAAPIEPATLVVMLLGPKQTPVAVWTFANAWPVKWEVAEMDAGSSGILTETLEIAYATVTRSLAAGGVAQ